MNDKQEPITEPNNAHAIGARVRELRSQKGLSLTELAERAGVSKSHLSTTSCET